jgi:hypothetical protein
VIVISCVVIFPRYLILSIIDLTSNSEVCTVRSVGEHGAVPHLLIWFGGE